MHSKGTGKLQQSADMDSDDSPDSESNSGAEKPEDNSTSESTKKSQTNMQSSSRLIDAEIIDSQEKIARTALFSINRIDLINPILPMTFGRWNNRPIQPKALRELKEAFDRQGILAYNLDNALPLVLRRDHLHPDALNEKIGDGENAPMLKLTDEGMKEKGLLFAGGRHRTHLINELWKERQKVVTKLEGKLDKAKGNLNAKLEKGKSAEAVKSLHQQIDDLEKELEIGKGNTLWVVKVYDADIVTQHGELAAQYLSRNMTVTHHAEDDSQKTLRLYKEYVTIKDHSNTSKALKKWLENISKGDQNALQVFQCEEDLAYMAMLHSFEDSLHNSEVFSMKWIRHHLHGKAGGIILRTLQLITDATHGLFTLIKNFEMEDRQSFERYVQMAERKEDSEKAVNMAVRIWKSIKREDRLMRATDELYVKSLGADYADQNLMMLVDEVFMEHLGKQHKQSAFTYTLTWEDGIQKYYDAVEVLINDHVVESPHQDKKLLEVADGIKARLQWIRYNHFPFYPMQAIPLFSPSVVVLTVESFERVGPAIVETLSWIYPYLAYSILRPTANGPKDISAAFFRMVKSNFDDEWKDPGKLINDIVHLMHQLLDQLTVMTLDLEELNIPPRPDKLGPKADISRWGVSENDLQLTITNMKHNKKTPKKMGSWVLRKRIEVVALSQNVDRDYVGIAQAALIEEKVVAKYRKDLFDSSNSAIWVRQCLEGILMDGVKKKAKSYGFPDGIKLGTVEKPSINLASLEVTRRMDRMYREEINELEVYTKRMLQSVIGEASPWRKGIHPDVARAVEACHLAILKNCQRRDLMRRHGKHLIDITSKEWEIKEDEIDTTVNCIIGPIYSAESADEDVDKSEEDSSGDEEDTPLQIRAPYWRLKSDKSDKSTKGDAMPVGVDLVGVMMDVDNTKNGAQPQTAQDPDRLVGLGENLRNFADGLDEGTRNTENGNSATLSNDSGLNHHSLKRMSPEGGKSPDERKTMRRRSDSLKSHIVDSTKKSSVKKPRRHGA